ELAAGQFAELARGKQAPGRLGVRGDGERECQSERCEKRAYPSPRHVCVLPSVHGSTSQSSASTPYAPEAGTAPWRLPGREIWWRVRECPRATQKRASP